MTKDFKELGLSETLLENITNMKIETPTEIQEKSIPPVLEGKDVIGGSATGSGKTLVFGAGIIQNTQRGKGIQSLVLTPTRELAEQISQALKKFSKHIKLEITEVYGGVSINPQIHKLRTADVVIATPGRLLDHLQRKTIFLGKVKILVIDEADRMFDMGFVDDIEEIIRKCPRERQTLLFSATIDRNVNRLSRKYMNDPVIISAKNQVDPSKLKQVYYDVTDKQKLSLLVHLLKKEKEGLVMIFCNTRRTVDFVERNLTLQGIEAQSIHGGLTQGKRTNVLQSFHSGKVYVLICTDVAARGLDIKGVTHVYNYDIPAKTEQYIHRIGRTARAGENGKAINLLDREQHMDFSKVIRQYKLNIEKQSTPQFETIKIKGLMRLKSGGPASRRPQSRPIRSSFGRKPMSGRRRGWKGRPTKKRK